MATAEVKRRGGRAGRNKPEAPGAGEQKAQVMRRLKRLEGQIRGLQRMIEEDAPCEEVLIQFSAVRSAFESAGVNILSEAMRDCIFEKAGGPVPQAAVDRALRLFQKYACYLR